MGFVSSDLRKKLRPLTIPAAATGALVLTSMMSCTSADRVRIHYTPDELVTKSIKVDRIERRRERVRHIPPRPGYFHQITRFLISDAYPGVTFRLAYDARSATISAGTYSDLTLTRDPAEAVQQHAKFPNFSTMIDVVGISSNGRVIADAVAAYERAVASKQRKSRLALVALLLALLPAGIIVVKLRRV
ncbi:hypothetical protein ABFT80_26275 [Mesorhizobium sp. SB112]|uniref:hypothetical protein n=1 Tax=Mesorhizobium sp. SB112 TaxID=3151853 RepID=UPI0032669553